MMKFIQSNPFIWSPSTRSNRKLAKAQVLSTYLLLRNSSGNFLLLLVEGLLTNRFDCTSTGVANEPEIENWKWDSDTRTKAQGLLRVMQIPAHVVK